MKNPKVLVLFGVIVLAVGGVLAWYLTKNSPNSLRSSKSLQRKVAADDKLAKDYKLPEKKYTRHTCVAFLSADELMGSSGVMTNLYKSFEESGDDESEVVSSLRARLKSAAALSVLSGFESKIFCSEQEFTEVDHMNHFMK
ncbi:MAG: hypothetical protein HYS98_08770 [Deltaproteobacteria bacterium]|nr:hypothetical protein [Deltaproteobacteria bacterium]